MLQLFVNDPHRPEPELRQFGVACCWRIGCLSSDERLRNSMEVRERYERGEATVDELEGAIRSARKTRNEIRKALIQQALPLNIDEHSPEAGIGWAAGAVYNAVTGNFNAASELAAFAQACAMDGDWQRNYELERAFQAGLLRSIIRTRMI